MPSPTPSFDSIGGTAASPLLRWSTASPGSSPASPPAVPRSPMRRWRSWPVRSSGLRRARSGQATTSRRPPPPAADLPCHPTPWLPSSPATRPRSDVAASPISTTCWPAAPRRSKTTPRSERPSDGGGGTSSSTSSRTSIHSSTAFFRPGSEPTPTSVSWATPIRRSTAGTERIPTCCATSSTTGQERPSSGWTSTTDAALKWSQRRQPSSALRVRSFAPPDPTAPARGFVVSRPIRRKPRASPPSCAEPVPMA